MVGSSKILTVSYGTFSCTLEGFDDSFGTMKAIAEYFRDLAAEDRYFGAEPPVPDAEMLARIAEREIARRVEARMDASGIVLRVGAAVSAQEAGETPVANAAPVVGPAAAEEVAPETVATTESVAETADEAPAATEATAQPALRMPPAVRAPADFSAADIVSDQGDSAAAAAAPAFVAPIAQAPAHPDADSVAAKLQRIRAVVGRSAGLMATGDEAEDLTPARPMPDFADTELGAAPAAAPVADDAPANDTTAQDAASDQPAAPLAEDVAVESVAEEVAEAPEATPHIRVVRMRRAEMDHSDIDGSQTHVVVETAEISESIGGEVADLSATEAALDWAEEDLSDDDLVAEIGTTDAAPNPAGNPPADSVAEQAPPMVAEALAESTLSAEDEADLLAALAEVEREADDQEATQAIAIEEKSDDEPDPEIDSDADWSAEEEARLAAAVAGDDIAAEPAADMTAVLARVMAADAPVVADYQSDDEKVVTDEAEEIEDTAAELVAADLDLNALEDAPDEAELADLALMDGVPELYAEAAAQEADAIIGSGDDAKDSVLEALAARLAEDATEAKPQEDDTAVTAFAPRLDDVMEAVDGAVHAQADQDEVIAQVDAAPEDDLEADDAAAYADEDHFEDEQADHDVALSATASHERDNHAMLRNGPDADEAALSRIMSQTDERLNLPESSRRREAIAHLKAAVAATEAARRLGDLTADDDGVENAFRDDLMKVVRPRRAAIADTDGRSERPRPAPLKLVASQRIDSDLPRVRAVPVQPVRPRRVTVGGEGTGAAPAQVAPAQVVPAQVVTPTQVAARADAGTFAEFAENMGARELPDLLEAAAAYTAFVEGMEDFSRPQILQKLRGLVPDDFSREDGLRFFGTLLRQGRITRVRNGRFSVADDTRFNPERRVG